MTPWIYVISFLVLGIFLFWWNTQQTKEGFGIFRSRETEYTNAQRINFHDSAGKEILINKGLRLGGINDALKQADMYLPTSPDRDYSVYFREDDNAFQEQDINLCRGAIHPRNLSRQPRATIGCGWWYVDNATSPSTGALGRVREPIDVSLSQTHPGGRWIWNLDEAAKLEDIKKCKRVRSCDAINADGIRGECGFCHEKGYAVPIDGAGNPKYPESDEGSCGETVVLTADQCTTAQQEIVDAVTADANTEYEYDDDGNVIDTITEQVVEVANLCDPDSNGKLSRDCLISLAKSVGMGEGGAIIKMIRSRSPPSNIDKYAIDLLTKNLAITIPDAVLGDGGVTRDTASSTYSRIVQGITTGSFEMVREAAKWLAIGTTSFDICGFRDRDVGPFPLECLQREFRKAGCQPAGRSAPSEENESEYDSYTFGQLKQYFKGIYDRMKSTTKSAQQDAAIADCLGVSFSRQIAPPCEETGIEYFVYSNNNNTPGTFIGRIVSKSGYIVDVENNQPSSLTKMMDLVNGRPMFISRSNITSPKTQSFIVRGWHSQQASFDVKLNTTTIQRRQIQTWSGLAESEWVIPLQPNIRYQFTTSWMNGPINKNWPNCDFIKENPSLFQLSQDSWRPIIAADFFNPSFKLPDNETVDDTNKVVKMRGYNLRFETVGGIRAAAYNGSTSALQILNPIRLGTIGTFTWMARISQFTRNPVLLWFDAYYNPGSVGTSVGRSALAYENNVEGVFFYTTTRSGENYTAAARGSGTSRLNKWTHYAVVFSPDRKGVDLFIDGIRVASATGNTMTDAVYDACWIGSDNFKGHLAWFHIYDYSLTQNEILRDMNYNNPSYVMPEPDLVDIKTPEPTQGRCPSGMYQYGMYAGGFCCPVKPINYRRDVNDYDNCPTTSWNNKTLCAIDPKRTQGQPICVKDGGSAGGGGGTSFDFNCNNGYVTQIFGSAGQFLTGLEVKCNNWQYSPHFGRFWHNFGTEEKQDGFNSINLRSGAWMDAISIDGALPQKGGNGGGPTTLSCGSGKIVGIYGRHEPSMDANAGQMHRIGIRCSL